MSEEKLSSDKVPQKFAEWLLSMGCPSETVPSVDKLAEMCRGPYYMVWRSLMEHVEPKDTIRTKRLQVFNNDLQRCQKQTAFSKPDSSVVVPEELKLWKQQNELRNKLNDAEERVLQAKQECDQMVDKVSSKLSQRNLVRTRVLNAQRRAWLLQQVSDELRNKKANLLETRSIADSLCRIDDNVDVESKLDKCTSTRHQLVRSSSVSATVNTLQNSLTSNTGDSNDTDDHISLVKCSGEVLWPQLCERRAALTAALDITGQPDKTPDNNRVSPHLVLSHTAALHCSLALDTLKHRAHIHQARNKLAQALTQLNHLSGESCELLVVRSEHARSDARLNTLRSTLDDVSGRQGAFATDTEVPPTSHSTKQINIVHKAIETKREELKRVITSLALIERKIQNVRECLINIFNSFHTEGYMNSDRFGGQLSMPEESMVTLRRFYEEKREKRRNKMELSMDLDTSNNYSYNDSPENVSPKFVDELRIYQKIFNLENNRKLILDSGEKIWIFETLNSSIARLHRTLQDVELICPIVCPSGSLRRNLQRVVNLVLKKEELTKVLRGLEGKQIKNVVIDITQQIEEERETIDKIKKRLNENLLDLQKTIKTLDLGQENLKIWSDNQMKKYILPSRMIDGKTYKDYEAYYIENIHLNM